MNTVIFVSPDKVTISSDKGQTQVFDIGLCHGFTPNLGDVVSISGSGDSIKIEKVSNQIDPNDSSKESNITVNDIKEEIYNRLGYKTRLYVTPANAKKISNAIIGIIVLALFIAYLCSK